nr:E3 binding domain-containing protein [Planctomycetota bacterium]
MPVEIKMPQMGESITEGTVIKWFVGPGDSIKRDEPLLEISTDKVDTEIPSPASGYVAELLVQEGETVPVDTLVCILSEEKPEPGSAASVSAAGAGDELSQADAGTEKETAGAGGTSGDKSWLSPAVRRLVRDNGVDPSAVQGTGEGGRLTRKDVMRHIENRKGTSTPSTEEGGREQAGGDRIEPMSVMRRKIAEHMV